MLLLAHLSYSRYAKECQGYGCPLPFETITLINAVISQYMIHVNVEVEINCIE